MSSKLTPTALPTPPKEYDIGYMDRLVKQIALEFTKSRAVTPFTCGSDLSNEAGFLISGLTIIDPPVSSTGSPPDGFPEGSVWCDTTSENSLKIITSGPYTDQDSLNLANTTDPALGDALIGFRQSNASGNLTGAVGRTVHEKLQEFVSVKDFGADPTGVADSTAAIQAAINSNPAEVFFPEGTYRITSLLYIDGGIKLIGAGGVAQDSRIVKTTTTVGTGSNLSRGGTVTDSYAQNAILIFRHPDDGYTYNTTIKGISFESDGYIVEYGIYAPRVTHTILEDVLIFQCRIGFITYDGWFNNFTKVVSNANTQRAINGGPTYGWATLTYGFYWANDGSGGAAGTSLNADTCWARDCDYGWVFYGLKYSTLNGCGADNISNLSYYFTLAEVSMNGCATENVQIRGLGALYFEYSNITMNSCSSYQVFGGTSGTTAFLFADGGNIVLNSCKFENFAVPNTSFNVGVQNGAKVALINSTLPTNGNSFISYGSNSQVVDFGTTPPSVKSSTANSLPRYVMGRVRDNQLQETTNKAIASGGTVIATFTAQAAATLETAVCRFTVSWYDASFPSASGISTFVTTVYVDTAGTNYDQNISPVTSSAAGNTGGVVTAPTFAFSRVGPVWSLTMTPAHGDCTAHTITAELQNIQGITLALP
jgi:hypothetical protein